MDMGNVIIGDIIPRVDNVDNFVDNFYKNSEIID